MPPRTCGARTRSSETESERQRTERAVREVVTTSASVVVHKRYAWRQALRALVSRILLHGASASTSVVGGTWDGTDLVSKVGYRVRP